VKTAANSHHDVREDAQRAAHAAQEARTSHTPWERVRIGDALRLINGRAFKPSEWSQQGLPIVRIGNLNDPDAPSNYYEGDLPQKFRLKKGDLLFAWSGTPGTSFGAHIWRGSDAWLNQHIFKVVFDEKQFDKRFLCYAINQNLNEYIAVAHGGAGLAHITKGKFEASTIIYPVLDEQKRLVAEIEKQLSRLDEAVAYLRRLKAQLEHYKSAIFTAAVGGRLVSTEAQLARSEGRTFETGAQLLNQILEVQRSDWDGKGDYKEPFRPETGALPKLPEGWEWSSVDQVAVETLIGLDRGREAQNVDGIGVPYVKMNNVNVDGEVTWENLVFVDADAHERQHFLLVDGDILFNTRNSKELVGKTGLVRRPPSNSIFNNNLMRIRVSKGVSSPFVCVQMCSHEFRHRLERVKKATTNVAAVYAKDLLRLPVALPPLAEQQRIVAEVDRHKTVASEVGTQVEISLQRAHQLRQRVLSMVFSAHR